VSINREAHPDTARRLLAALVALKRAGISADLIIVNDSGFIFDETVDYLDKVANAKYWR
jgi:hypothetical protein